MSYARKSFPHSEGIIKVDICFGCIDQNKILKNIITGKFFVTIIHCLCDEKEKRGLSGVSMPIELYEEYRKNHLDIYLQRVQLVEKSLETKLQKRPVYPKAIDVWKKNTKNFCLNVCADYSQWKREYLIYIGKKKVDYQMELSNYKDKICGVFNIPSVAFKINDIEID